MGSGWNINNPPAHFNGYYKARISFFNPPPWFQNNNILTINKDIPISKTYYLYPVELKSSGASLIWIPVSSFDRGYLGFALEYRQPIGTDKSYFSGNEHGLYIRRGINYDYSNINIGDLTLLDNNPQTSTFKDAALDVGKTFTTSLTNGYKLSITNQGAKNIIIGRRKATNVLQVKVDIGPSLPVCIECRAPNPGCRYVLQPGQDSCKTCGQLVCQDTQLNLRLARLARNRY